MADYVEKFKRSLDYRLTGLALATIVILAGLAAVDYRQLSLTWINLYWLTSATFALYLSLVALPTRHGLRRTARIALSLAVGLVFLGQLIWGLQVWFDWSVFPGPSDIVFLSVPLPAIWAALVVIRNRVSGASEMTAVLDAASMSLAILTIILIVFGQAAVGFGRVEAVSLLLYPILYLSPCGAFLVASLAVREEPRFGGNWLIMLGSLVSGLCFAVWTASALAGNSPVATLVEYFFGVGIILIGLGAATIDTVPASSTRKRRALVVLSELLPLVAIVVAVLATLIADIPVELKPLVWTVVVCLLVVNTIRQVLLTRSHRQGQRSLRALSAEQTKLEETERRKIGTYLHDKVGQSVAVMSLKLGEIRRAMDNSERNSLLDDADSLLSSIADEVRTTTFDISSPVLHELGLLPAVGNLAATFGKEFGIDIRFVDDGFTRTLPESVKALLYRFVRELLMNVVKYAEADRVSVTMSQDLNSISIVVEDNGVGFDTRLLRADVMNGFGLFSIRERTRAIGGIFKIRSTIGEGTRASVVLPVDP